MVSLFSRSRKKKRENSPELFRPEMATPAWHCVIRLFMSRARAEEASPESAFIVSRGRCSAEMIPTRQRLRQVYSGDREQRSR